MDTLPNEILYIIFSYKSLKKILTLSMLSSRYYFLIYDNDNNEAYFVFQNKLKDKSL